MRLKLDKWFNLYFNSNISEHVSAMAFKLGMKVGIFMGFDDLAIDARSHWLGSGKQISFELISTTKQAMTD